MKAKSIIRQLLLVGSILSVACTGAFAAEQKTGDNLDLNLSIESTETTVNAIGQEGLNLFDFNDLTEAKFFKENGKVFYEDVDGKKEVQLENNNVEVTEDGKLYYSNENGEKVQLKMLIGTDKNGSSISVSIVNEEEAK